MKSSILPIVIEPQNGGSKLIVDFKDGAIVIQNDATADQINCELSQVIDLVSALVKAAETTY